VTDWGDGAAVTSVEERPAGLVARNQADERAQTRRRLADTWIEHCKAVLRGEADPDDQPDHHEEAQ